MVKHLRVVVSCVTFETVKIVEPIKYYKADKVYLLHMGKKGAYKDFIDEVENQVKKLGIEYELVETVVWEFSPVLKELLRILHWERTGGNHVFVNIAAGPHSYAAAGMVACMMEDAQPFFVGTKEFAVDAKEYYVRGKPVGMTKKTYDPKDLPTFQLKRPPPHLVDGLRVWKRRKDNKWIMNDSGIIKELEENELMENVLEGKTVTQKAKMLYRRKFLEKWLEKGWLRSVGRGEYEITEAGEVAVEVF